MNGSSSLKSLIFFIDFFCFLKDLMVSYLFYLIEITIFPFQNLYSIFEQAYSKYLDSSSQKTPIPGYSQLICFGKCLCLNQFSR